jgi:NAD(P)-dependent dehydrogenase (short-subunit alcohol dehydrogenase family)
VKDRPAMHEAEPLNADWARPFFTGKTVLVTGGTSGIGAAIAAGFAQAGALVTATGATESEVESAQNAHAESGIAFAPLDVRDRADVEGLVSRFDALDVAVNCAGVIRRGDELDPDVFASVVDINLTGSMRVCAAARPLLARSGCGAIINLASMLSFQGGGLVPGYSASKGGIAQMTKSLAIAYAADGIRVNAVAPGWIATALTKNLRDDPARSDAIIGRTAMKRWGKPGDVVGGALFLASPAASFVTGVILPIDGGYLVT